MKEPEKLVTGVTETARMCRSRHRITKATTALCYILTGAVLVWAISLATQGEGLACGILAAFAGLLVWYAQDEKKTAHVSGMEVRKMDDRDRAIADELGKMTLEEKNVILQLALKMCMKNAAPDAVTSKAAQSAKPITNTPSLSRV